MPSFSLLVCSFPHPPTNLYGERDEEEHSTDVNSKHRKFISRQHTLTPQIVQTRKKWNGWSPLIPSYWKGGCHVHEVCSCLQRPWINGSWTRFSNGSQTRPMVLKLTMVPVPFFHNGLLFLALLVVTILDCTRSCTIQDGSAQENQDAKDIPGCPCEFTMEPIDTVMHSFRTTALADSWVSNLTQIWNGSWKLSSCKAFFSKHFSREIIKHRYNREFSAPA